MKKKKTPDRYDRDGRPVPNSRKVRVVYTGPDGERFDDFGAPLPSNSYTGPDGETFHDHELI